MTLNVRRRLEKLVRVNPLLKPKIYRAISESAEVHNFNYWLELALSAGIATLGLVLSSPAVVIGAMLISPLMGPILAAGLAVAAADVYLYFKSLLNLLLSVVGALLFSAFLVWLLPFHAVTPEILARVHPNLLDLGVAVFSGLAGAVAVYRSSAGRGSTALPGVAIAVALMPPLCVVGFGIGAGFQTEIILGAGLLFVTNLAAIVASAFGVFYMLRMDAPEVRSEIDAWIVESSSRDRLYQFLQASGFRQSLADIGRLPYRVGMLAAALALLFVPLSKSLFRVKDETLTRAAVEEVMRRLVPREALITSSVDLSPGSVKVRVVSTATPPKAAVENAERELIRRTGREVDILVRSVASQEEMQQIRARFAAPAVPQRPPSLGEARSEVLERIRKPLQTAWPSDLYELLSFQALLASEETVVRIRYRAPKDAPEELAAVLGAMLRHQLEEASLRVELFREPGPQKTAPQPAQRRK